MIEAENERSTFLEGWAPPTEGADSEAGVIGIAGGE
jgi:hypothetical protein